MGEILRVWRDTETRSASGQMATDHRLLCDAKSPVIRFYAWDKPAITIGYFVSEAEVQTSHPGVEIARRRTGGGIVEHGDDVTFALAVPKSGVAKTSAFGRILKAPAPERYRWIHRCLAHALEACGIRAAVAGVEIESATDTSRCFAAPVVSDVIDPDTGVKIAGGAQRRSREGWLHQGSVRLEPPHNQIDAEWTRAFCEELGGGRDAVFQLIPFINRDHSKMDSDDWGTELVWVHEAEGKVRLHDPVGMLHGIGGRRSDFDKNL